MTDYLLETLNIHVLFSIITEMGLKKNFERCKERERRQAAVGCKNYFGKVKIQSRFYFLIRSRHTIYFKNVENTIFLNRHPHPFILKWFLPLSTTVCHNIGKSDILVRVNKYKFTKFFLQFDIIFWHVMIFILMMMADLC